LVTSTAHLLRDGGNNLPGIQRRKSMKTAGKILAAGAAIAIFGGIGAYAFAQQGPGFGSGMRGMGHGMMMGMNHGSATMEERRDIHSLLFNHDRIKRSVTNLPDGIRTVTESDDPEIAETIRKHVAEMGQRVEDGRDPDLPIESPALRSIFQYKDKIKSTYEVTDKGIVVVQTSTDANAVEALQKHAAEVTDLVDRGMVAAHETMMKNHGGMMGRGMHGAMANRRHGH
jgi:glutamate-1-semialdehyde aminotransferase